MRPKPRSILTAAGLALGLSLPPVRAEVQFPAVLAGHAVLPALSFVPAPPGAPPELQVSGKLVTGQRVDTAGAVEALSGGRPTGVRVPFQGQPLQGHSALRRVADGSVWVLGDNGAGSRANSPDYLLHLSRHRLDFGRGRVHRQATVFLSDPLHRVPFPIVTEGSADRLLTGADFDPESLEFIGDSIWIGDEFGPYLLRTDRQGRVRAVIEARVDGRPLRSPDHTPGPPAAGAAGATPPSLAVDRSRGFEGLSASPDGSRLYALLEGPVKDPASSTAEAVDGRPALRILEFDPGSERWTGRHWFYPLEGAGHAVGEFRMIDATRALVIERDGGEGVAQRACPHGEPRGDCFPNPARYKRVVLVGLDAHRVGGAVRRIGFIDLLAIRDPHRRARTPLDAGLFSFPFVTIEGLDRVGARHILVANDNNLPFSSGRHPSRPDDNEFILLEVPALLRAR